MRSIHFRHTLATAIGLSAAAIAFGQTSSLTYQGQLMASGNVANGTQNMVFSLFDAPTGGNLIGSQSVNGVSVADGLFTAVLNGAGELGASAFNGQARWLEIVVNGTTLTPRQTVTAAPQALFASKPWETNGSSVFYSAGNVGIGTSNPQGALHVASLGNALVISPPSMQAGDSTSIMFSDPDGGTGPMSIAYRDDGTPGLWINGGYFRVNGDFVSMGTGYLGALSVSNNMGVVGTIFTTDLSATGTATLGTANLGTTSIAALNDALTIRPSTMTNGQAARIKFVDPDASTGPVSLDYTDNGTAGLSLSGGSFNIPSGSLTVSGTTTTNNLSATGTTTANNLTVNGTATTNNISATGTATVNNLTVNGTTSTKGMTVPINTSTNLILANGGGQPTGIWNEITGDTTPIIDLANNCFVTGTVNSHLGGMFRIDTRGTSQLWQWLTKNAGTGSATVVGSMSNTGTLTLSGAINATAKNFRIDHPSDPANKFLMHACIESNENLNIYRGNVVLNDNGAAMISLPNWMQDLNEDFSYQLTPIGGAAQLYVSQELQNNTFSIAGGKPGMKVSWVVTGARKDAYIKAHPLIVEQDKLGADKGKFINPELFGAGPEQAIGYIAETPVEQISQPVQPEQTIEPAEPAAVVNN